MDATLFTPLPREFYEPSAAVVAPRLLGHRLLRSTPAGVCGGVIVEVEAYGENDPACHAYLRATARNAAMWGPCGYSYVYLIYGMHFCFNAVCRPAGVAEAVLVRAIEPEWNVEEMQSRRPGKQGRELTGGPGRLCAALAIDRTLDGADLCDVASPLFIACNPQRSTLLQEHGSVVQTTRIGISRAADLPWRWYLGGSVFVSKR